MQSGKAKDAQGNSRLLTTFMSGTPRTKLSFSLTQCLLKVFVVLVGLQFEVPTGFVRPGSLCLLIKACCCGSEMTVKSSWPLT